MSFGALKSEADLRRWLENELRTPGVMPREPQAAISLTKAGAPSDNDFPAKPGNGLLALDTSTEPWTLYARANDEWKPL
jgi:hypothetical protein